MLAGRLADPNCSLGTDPRADPRMVKALKPFALDDLLPTPSVTPDSPLQDRLDWCARGEVETGAVLAALSEHTPVAAGVNRETVVIDGSASTAAERLSPALCGCSRA